MECFVFLLLVVGLAEAATKALELGSLNSVDAWCWKIKNHFPIQLCAGRSGILYRTLGTFQFNNRRRPPLWKCVKLKLIRLFKIIYFDRCSQGLDPVHFHRPSSNEEVFSSNY